MKKPTGHAMKMSPMNQRMAHKSPGQSPPSPLPSPLPMSLGRRGANCGRNGDVRFKGGLNMI